MPKQQTVFIKEWSTNSKHNIPTASILLEDQTDGGLG